MYYKIVKSLGRVSAILSEDIPQQGICLEFKKIQDSNYSILLYQNGKLKDFELNGWTFPYIFNNVTYYECAGNIVGKFYYSVSFELIDPSGIERHIDNKELYGETELKSVEYFFTLLYNISCCENFDQYNDLYKYVYDKNYFVSREKNFPFEAISFINKFTPHLSKVSTDDYLPGLKRTIDIRLKEEADRIKAQGVPK